MSIALKVNKLREILDDKELDAILVSSPPNRRYLSGFTGSAGYLLISRSESVLCTDFRYLDNPFLCDLSCIIKLGLLS